MVVQLGKEGVTWLFHKGYCTIQPTLPSNFIITSNIAQTVIPHTATHISNTMHTRWQTNKGIIRLERMAHPRTAATPAHYSLKC